MCMHEFEFLRITLNKNATRACYSYYSQQIEKNREKSLNMKVATQEKLMFLFLIMIFVYRSSHPKAFCKTDVLNNFPNF